MSSAEKLQLADLPIAIMLFLMGVCFLALRKKMSVARMERVKKGEMSSMEATKADRLVMWAGISVTACGLFLLAMWATGH